MAPRPAWVCLQRAGQVYPFLPSSDYSQRPDGHSRFWAGVSIDRALVGNLFPGIFVPPSTRAYVLTVVMHMLSGWFSVPSALGAFPSQRKAVDVDCHLRVV